eukprot:Gb_01717 [translate_table: standard]
MKDVNGHKRDKAVQEDFPLGVVGPSLTRWSIESSTAKGESLGRIKLKRRIEMHVKRHVKQQYFTGKFYDLVKNVIATPEILQAAYESIRLSSNIVSPNMSELSIGGDGNAICFSSIAKQLIEGEFDVKSNTQELFPLVDKNEPLVLPSLKLKVIQEATRMVLEVVYRPQFSRISHSCKSGRGQHSALKYIQNQIRNPKWWFNIAIQKKLDTSIFMKLVATMKEKIHDDSLFKLLGQMFDANVLNVEFGGFPKGQGCPQEGILSSVLMNIYLDLFDQEFYKICLDYEALDQRSDCEHKMNSPNQMQHFSKLRQWLRNKMKLDSQGAHSTPCNCQKLHACRYMDEIFIATSGSKELALDLMDRIFTFLEVSLNLEVDRTKSRVRNAALVKLRFLGMDIQTIPLSELQYLSKEIPVKVVLKLSNKIKLFALQKQWHWEAWTKRLGKKWLAHALKEIKEADKGKPGMTSKLNEYRKLGMKSDHWFKEILKVWIQQLHKEFQMDKQKNSWLESVSEEELLAELIIQPELPQDLRESFNQFQQKVDEYVISEAATMNSLKESLESTRPGTADTKSSKEIRIMGTSSMFACACSSGRFTDYTLVYWTCYEMAKHRTTNTEIMKQFAGELSIITLDGETEVGSPLEPEIAPSSNFYLTDRTSFDNGLWLLIVNRSCDSFVRCSIACCNSRVTKVYRIYRNRKEHISGLKRKICTTGFVTLHPSFERKYIALCMEHVKDLYLGDITLQDIDFTFAPFSRPS